MKVKIKNFIKGIASIFNISGNNFSIKIKSDYNAIKEDWEAVGKDLKNVIKN